MKRILPAAVLLGLLLTGCSLSSLLPVGETRAAEQENYYAAATEAAENQYQPPLLESQSVCLWARQQLSIKEQEVYDLLARAAENYDEEPVQVEASSDQVRRSLLALRIDHPEYYWFDGEATYASASVPLLGDSTSVTLTYTMDRDTARSYLPQVEAYTQDCLASIADAGTDYDRILGVYRYIIEHTDYVQQVQDQSMICAMTQHQATCAGYARAFQYLMLKLNIPCTLILGTGSGGESHGWNAVQCDGEWYQVDVTWGDPVDENGAPGTSLDYTYFMITDWEMYRDHTPDHDIPAPTCTATADNYYRRAGRQLASWDSLQYESIIRSAAAQGESWVTVRFDRQGDYDTALRALIDQGGIMTVLENCGIAIPDSGITYSRNDGFLQFSVELFGE